MTIGRIPTINDAGYEIMTLGMADDTSHYEPRSLNFHTSVYDSLYNRNDSGANINDGVDYNDGHLHFYNTSNQEMNKEENETIQEFQTRLTNNCVKTILEWEPAFDYRIFGGTLMVKNPPTNPAYFWVVVAPDYPAPMGSTPFISGGWELSYFQDKSYIKMDGKTCSKLVYQNGGYPGTNKLALICKHGIGVAIGIQMIFEFYRS